MASSTRGPGWAREGAAGVIEGARAGGNGALSAVSPVGHGIRMLNEISGFSYVAEGEFTLGKNHAYINSVLILYYFPLFLHWRIPL
jgi:hypothetical protein